MAILNTVKKMAQGLGNPLYYSTTTLTATNSQTVTMTLSTPTGAPQGTSIGMWRVKIGTLTTATTVSSLVITASNGTTTENVASMGPFATNSRPVNQLNEFITDLSPGYTNFVLVVTLGAAGTGIIDFEFFGNP